MTRPLTWYVRRPFEIVLGILMLMILYPILGARELWKDMTKPPPKNPNSLWPPVQSPKTAKIMARTSQMRVLPIPSLDDSMARLDTQMAELNTRVGGMGDWIDLTSPQGASAHGDLKTEEF